jgi:hypothetical protein
MIITLLKFITSPIGTGLGAIALVIGLVASFAYQQQQVGGRKAVARQEKVDVQIVNRAQEAARRAADPTARGLRDPNAAAK